jgi:Txe/YoeB family toxin of Txe-Axe toxin-antitoxin module
MYTQVNKLKDAQFRRKTGVKRKTFNKMVEIVREVEEKRKKISGRPSKLEYEDQVLMSLEYLREYRTYFSLGQIYELSEANTYKICKKVEDILIQSKEFRLPNRKDVYEDPNIEVIVVDAVESSIERPQKNKGNTTRERKRSIPLKLR